MSRTSHHPATRAGRAGLAVPAQPGGASTAPTGPPRPRVSHGTHPPPPVWGFGFLLQSGRVTPHC